MGVSVQGESHNRVAKNLADGFRMDAGFEHSRCDGVAKFMKSNALKPTLCHSDVEELADAIRMHGMAVFLSEDMARVSPCVVPTLLICDLSSGLLAEGQPPDLSTLLHTRTEGAMR